MLLMSSFRIDSAFDVAIPTDNTATHRAKNDTFAITDDKKITRTVVKRIIQATHVLFQF